MEIQTQTRTRTLMSARALTLVVVVRAAMIAASAVADEPGVALELLAAEDTCFSDKDGQCSLSLRQLRSRHRNQVVEIHADKLLVEDRAALGRNGSANATLVPDQERNGSANATLQPDQEVRILHISDTHNLHHTIEDKFPMPPADILIHSGDFTNFGTDEELADANKWLGTLRLRYKHIIAITGNHDWITDVRLPGEVTIQSGFWSKRLSNAKLLQSEEITVMGLRIFGSSWKGGQSHANPHGFGEIPSNLDILVTHGPPYNILDWCWSNHWGSSDELFADVMKQRPKVHLFGHDHEQRGMWERDSTSEPYKGGVEYEVNPGSGRPFPTTGPPPDNYPSQLVSNNAMMNHPGHEGWTPARIAGPARLIIARRISGEWHFHSDPIGMNMNLSSVDPGVA